MSVGFANGQLLAELVHVCRQIGLNPEGNLVPVDVQAGTIKGFSESKEGATQGGEATAAIVLGPEKVDQGIAAEGLARDGEVGQQGRGLVPGDPDRNAVALEPRWSKQAECKVTGQFAGRCGHQPTSFTASLLEIEEEVNKLLGRPGVGAIRHARRSQRESDRLWDGA